MGGQTPSTPPPIHPRPDVPPAPLPTLVQQADALMKSRGLRNWPAAEADGPQPYFTGYPCGRIYGWDQYFEAIIQWHLDWSLRYARRSLELFLGHIDRDGYVPRTLPRIWWGEFHAQPFLAQQALLLRRAGDGLQWLFPRGFYQLKQYLVHWLFHMDRRGAGLSVWDHAGHSGMDNQWERAGTFHDRFCEGVDLNAWLVRECHALALLADHFRLHADAREAREWARQRAAAINRWCWREDEGLYYDFHAVRREPIGVKHVGMFAALWARVADAAQAHRLVHDHLLNPDEFWRNWPLPALAATEPGYVDGRVVDGPELDCCSWRAHSWMPTNYIAFEGLRAYGEHAAAEALALRNEQMFRQAPFREYYSADTGAGRGRDPFWGWSSLALFMRRELHDGHDPTCLDPGGAASETAHGQLRSDGRALDGS